jgi:DNA polymerase-3 subunit beta
MPGVVVPAAACDDIAAALADAGANDVARVRFNAGRLAFDYGSRRLVTKLVDGTYPESERLVPAPGRPHRAEFRRSEMVDTLSRVCVVSNGHKGVKETGMSFAGDEITLWATHDDGHTADDAVGAACEGGQHTFGINASYMLEQLNKMRGVKVRLEHENPGSPLRLYDDGVAEAVHIIMPMRIPARAEL